MSAVSPRVYPDVYNTVRCQPRLTHSATTSQETAMPKPTSPVQAAETSADAFGAAVGDILKSMSGLNLPAQDLAKLQGDYLKSVTDIWNQALSGAQAAGRASRPPSPTVASPTLTGCRTRRPPTPRRCTC
jgi:hypothetical protein